MPNNAFYVYGIVKSGVDVELNEKGLAGEEVYVISEGKFGALIHDCEEKPYPTEDPHQIKEMIIIHNSILNLALRDFEGVIPLSFNTIIKAGNNSAFLNLKKWLNEDQERLEKIWNRVKGKKEYGIRIYYDKRQAAAEASADKEIEEIERNLAGKSPGLSYLMQGKVKSKTQEIFQNKVKELKKEFYDEIKQAAEETVLNSSKISLEEEKDLLLSLSVLVEEKKVAPLKEILEKKEKEGFSVNLAGPFAPYSFVESR